MKKYIFKITLKDETKIERVLEITDNFSLKKLVEAILVAFNFKNQHEYYMKISDTEYLEDEKLIGLFKDRKIDSIDKSINEVLGDKNKMNKSDIFNMYYDMACFWDHEIEIVDILEENDKVIKVIKMIGDYLPEETGSTNDMELMIKDSGKTKEELFNYKIIGLDEINYKLSQMALM